MATYDDLFGSNGIATDKGSQNWMKWENDGETLLFQQTAEPEVSDQKTQDGKVKWMVQRSDGDKWVAMAEGSFDEDAVHKAFKPRNKDISIAGRVLGKKLKNGEKVEDFEEFDTIWELKSGDFLDKLKAEMLDTGHGAVTGTVYALKRLRSDVKPFQYSVKIVKAG